MPTNKPGLITIEQFMSDYTPSYQPLYPLFMGKAQQYAGEVGKIDFRRIATLGDIRAKHILPKDTEIRQISVASATKSFKKYFLANQYQLSHLQAGENTQQVIAEVLDEHQKQMDELFLLGEGSSNSTMINNGLYWSNDVNYLAETSAEISATNTLALLHAKVVAEARKANMIAGRKALIVYGTVLPYLNGVYADVAVPFRRPLAEVLGSNYSIVEMPDAVTPAGAGGFIIANLDQVKLHYTKMPAVDKQGSNDEKGYFWFNFLMGSVMLEVLAANAIIKQPITFAA